MKDLKSSENIIIIKAVKGGQIVILDKNHYNEGFNKLLIDGLLINLITITRLFLTRIKEN